MMGLLLSMTLAAAQAVPTWSVNDRQTFDEADMSPHLREWLAAHPEGSEREPSPLSPSVAPRSDVPPSYVVDMTHDEVNRYGWDDEIALRVRLSTDAGLLYTLIHTGRTAEMVAHWSQTPMLGEDASLLVDAELHEAFAASVARRGVGQLTTRLEVHTPEGIRRHQTVVGRTIVVPSAGGGVVGVPDGETRMIEGFQNSLQTVTP